MADVTGRMYESFTEFLLTRLGYRNEWTAGEGVEYRYEKRVPALCHTDVEICPHAAVCHELSVLNGLPYGPWYDPDFLILRDNRPVACLHVTHWSSPSDSSRKFWRTIEDHWQHKTFYGPDFISINLVFVALDEELHPRLVRDTDVLLPLEGWKPAISSVLAVSFDASVIFPRVYYPLERFARSVPVTLPGGSRARRLAYNQIWQRLYEQDHDLHNEVDEATRIVEQAIAVLPHPLHSTLAVRSLQDTCLCGRSHAISAHATESRYRKGIQHAFIVRELISRSSTPQVDADDAIRHILSSPPRFPSYELGKIVSAPSGVRQQDAAELRDCLVSVPIQISTREPVALLNPAAGVDHIAWNSDFAQFIRGLALVSEADRSVFIDALLALFASYRKAYGIQDVLADLYDLERVRKKIDYVANTYLGVQNREEFVTALSSEMLASGATPPHQSVVRDVHNWVVEALLVFFDLGRKQHIVNVMPRKFEMEYHESLRLYSFNGNFDQLLNHLLQGTPVGQYFSRRARLSEGEFYDAIGKVLAESIWEAIQGRIATSTAEAIVRYRYRKAMRIVSQSDLEPLVFLLHRALPDLEGGPTLRGGYNQLSVARKWSNSALTTDTAALDVASGAVIQTQSVFGEKHIADKTKELAARLRSVHLRWNDVGVFDGEPQPGVHYLVIDGDWPIASKINLFEAGFAGVFEIAELAELKEALVGRGVGTDKSATQT